VNSTARRSLRAEDIFGIPEIVRITDNRWEAIQISPDTTEVLFRWSITGTSELYAVPLAGGTPVRLTTTGPDSRCVQPQYAPDGALIAFLRDHDGDERFEIWLADRHGSAARCLTEGSTSLVRAQRCRWAPDGARLFYRAHERGARDIWSIDVATGKTSLLLSDLGGGDAVLPDWSPDGRFLAYHSGRPADPRSPELVVVRADGSSPAWHLETEGGEGILGLDPVWSPDGRWLAFTTSDRGRYEAAVVEMRDGRVDGPVRRVNESAHDDSMPTRRPKWGATGALLYARNQESTVSLRRADPRRATDSALVNSSGVCFDVAEASDGTIAYVEATPSRPPEVFVRRPGAETVQITDSLPRGFDRSALIEPRHLRYPGPDGKSIPGILWRTPGPGGDAPTVSPPAVVHAHGGGTYQHFQSWDPIAQWFTANGYVVLQVNGRGSQGYGSAWFNGNRGDQGGIDVDDHASGADWLASEGLADRDRIAIYGSSGGGYLAAMALARHPDRWAAGCMARGFVSWATLYETTNGLRPLIERTMGRPEDDPEFFRRSSVLTYIERIAAPVLILHGRMDPRVPVSEAELFARELTSHGKSFELHVFPDEGHGYRRLANLCDAFVRTVAFFDRHTKRGGQGGRK
jgi:dipeptidyl aminopeptidase/acylaminoacyl peptidase